MGDTQLGYVSLFSSAGLGCYGFKSAGFDCAATAELIPRRLDVQRANSVASDDKAYVLGYLTNATVRQYLTEQVKHWEKSNRTDITVIVATPPCQGMSVANHKKNDELGRNSLVVESIKIISELEPRFFVMENVRAFLTSACRDIDGKLKPIREAIDTHLLDRYNIFAKVVNFKDYGANSSRTRTLVLGVRRDIQDVTPIDLFPDRAQAPTLRNLIGDLPTLNTMGQIDPNDIYHAFRSYNPDMRPWIHGLKPGQSAFDNVDLVLRPHHIVNGKVVENKASNGDKYRRNLWDRVAPCVHTRNDILASQSTIHPCDDRVFSIRELSRMMGVPDTFRWTKDDPKTLNALPEEQKRAFLKEHEINIRQCLGEGVPTQIFAAIAHKVALYNHTPRKHRGRPSKHANNAVLPPVASFVSDAERNNVHKKQLAAFYTRQDIVYSLLSTLPEYPRSKTLHILEPSVGAGAFVPLLIKRYGDHELHIDLIDINQHALEQAKELLAHLDIPNHVHLNYVNTDFLKFEPSNRYDIIVGNPPFGAPSHRPAFESKFSVRDLYALFLEKCLSLGEHVALVIPKTFLNGAEFVQLRNYVATKCAFKDIQDYGESAFGDIKIETIGLHVSHDAPSNTAVLSLPMRNRRIVSQRTITSKKFPSWLIYRNDFFDAMCKQLRLGCFEVYRDRSLTLNKQHSENGIPVVKARNIVNGRISLNAVQSFCAPECVPASFKTKISATNAIVVPNLSYYPRGAVLPQHCYVDGSAAVLIPHKNEKVNPDEVIKLWPTADFFFFYRIARNYSVRSLNVDTISVFYWGVPKAEYEPIVHMEGVPNSSWLYATASANGKVTQR